MKRRIAILGGGISGLSALHFLKSRYSDLCDATLFEKENRLGGTIGTDRNEGFVSDWGSNGFLDRVPLTLQLTDELNLTRKLIRANPASENRFILSDGILHTINPSPLRFMRSRVLSLRGRLRLITEPFRRAKNDDIDESILDFASRRIGPEAAERLVGPMVSGVFGGDPRNLSLKSCFPIMHEMEREHGSLIKAMIARRKRGKRGGPAGPGGRLTSFEGGLYTMIEGFHYKYADSVQTGREAVAISSDGREFTVNFESNDPMKFDAVICALPAYALAEMLRSLDDLVATKLASIPYASISVVCLGYKQEDIAHELNGFGFLIPRNQGMRMLGSIWTSSIFNGRAPRGSVQLRTMIGGATDADAIDLSDSQLVEIIHSELSEPLGIIGTPSYIRIYRWNKGIPQYVIGHEEKIKAAESFCNQHPGLAFTGNAYRGVGLNDCILQSERATESVVDYIRCLQ